MRFALPGLAILLIVVLPGAATAQPAADPPDGFQSPTAVWEQFVAATGSGRWADAWNCFERGSGVRLLAAVALNADAWVRLRGSEEQRVQWQQIVQRLRLRLPGPDAEPEGPPGERLPAIVAGIEDKATAFDQVIRFMATATGREAEAPLQGRLESVRIDGDSATATLVRTTNGQDVRQPLGFRRVDGKWQIDLGAR